MDQDLVRLFEVTSSTLACFLDVAVPANQPLEIPHAV